MRDKWRSIGDKREIRQSYSALVRSVGAMSKMFGTTLKQLMNERNLSAAQVAKGINCPAKTVQEWLGPNGRVPRDLEVLKRLAEFFKCSTHFILFGEEDPRSVISEILDKTEIHTGLYEITIKKVKRTSESSLRDKKGEV